MKATECIAEAHRLGEHWQLAINQFVDDFRRATPEERPLLVQDPVETIGKLEGLLAAVISSLCREVGQPPPPWVGTTGSPEPFFAIPANGHALRLRLMIESPPPFFVRNVFVPSNYLSRA